MVANNDEQQLVKEAQQGNRDAFMALYNRYIDRVYNRVKSRVPHVDADDVTQEIFIAVMQSLKSFKGNSSFSTWVYTIVNRQIADYYRRKYRKQPTVDINALEGTQAAPSYEEENLAEKAMLQKVLLEIPEHYQEIILMRFADGMKFATIAEERGQSLEAVKSLYRRAIQAVKDKIDGV